MHELPRTDSRLDQLLQGYYVDIDLSVHGALIAELENARDEMGYRPENCEHHHFDETINAEQALDLVSPERLAEIREQCTDRPVAGQDQNQLHFNTMIFRSLTKRVVETMYEVIQPRGHVQLGQSGRNWYPPGGYMGWHTNANVSGIRLYCNHALDPAASFFRYLDPLSGEIITSWDQQGWNFRLFRTDCAPVWHCVYSATQRISFGYKIKFLKKGSRTSAL